MIRGDPLCNGRGSTKWSVEAFHILWCQGRRAGPMPHNAVMISFYLRGMGMADVGTDLNGLHVLALFFLRNDHPLSAVLSCETG